VLSAIGRAGAGDLVEGNGQASALGLDTLLGPYIGGHALSGGQWQRLGRHLCRAVQPAGRGLPILSP
jgi:ABC-type multidrug transport system fused ATPase/permease subunit